MGAIAPPVTFLSTYVTIRRCADEVCPANGRGMSFPGPWFSRETTWRGVATETPTAAAPWRYRQPDRATKGTIWVLTPVR